MGIILVCIIQYIMFWKRLIKSIFSNGEINKIFIKKSNIFGASFTNTRIKNLLCEDIMPGRWTTQLVNKHLGYRYTGVFKTLASIDDKPSRFEILIPLVQTLVRDNVKLNNDVYKELNNFVLDYDKTSSEMRKYLQSINECMLLMKNIVHQVKTLPKEVISEWNYLWWLLIHCRETKNNLKHDLKHPTLSL